MTDPKDKRKKKAVFIWCEGTVVEVADGVTIKKSPRCKDVLPPGAVRIRWPKDVDFEARVRHGPPRPTGMWVRGGVLTIFKSAILGSTSWP